MLWLNLSSQFPTEIVQYFTQIETSPDTVKPKWSEGKNYLTDNSSLASSPCGCSLFKRSPFNFSITPHFQLTLTVVNSEAKSEQTNTGPDCGMCTMMQVQGSNMMEMGGSPAAAFWGARHPSWPATSHAGHQPATAATNQDPKVAEKLMTELQVRIVMYSTFRCMWVNQSKLRDRQSPIISHLQIF